MAQDRIRLPTSEAGLVRYSEEVSAKFQIKPETIIIFVTALIVLFIVLKAVF
ncbi:MAG: preprotein translocase subunit Sec61beta [Candidatus Nanoarchaeia archaeon]